MFSRVPAVLPAICLAVGVFVLYQTTLPRIYSGSEATVEFQDGAGLSKLLFSPGESARFYVRDPGLTTVGTSTAVWISLGVEVAAGEWWRLATGAPDPDSHVLIHGDQYDTSTPRNTPLATAPNVFVNGQPWILGDFHVLTGEIKLVYNVDASSTVRVDFAFDVVDGCPASEGCVNITSTSDLMGEWVAIAEVGSETDAGPSPTSGLYRGEVLLSGDASASESGDGVVWVRDGDALYVTYFGPDGAAPVASHQALVLTPAQVPAMHLLALVLLAVLLAIALAWGIMRKSGGSVSRESPGLR